MHQVLHSRLERQRAAFARDVRRGLSARPCQLPPKYFYDALGSALFEAICALPWYRITRAERRLLDLHATEIVERSGFPEFVFELGPGRGEKLGLLASAYAPAGTSAHLHLVDVSWAALAAARRALTPVAGVTVSTHRGTYEAGLRRIADVRRPAARTLAVFLGSNIGNATPAQALRLMLGIRRALRPGDHLLLGVDLVKPERDLLLAYDDPIGVTAAFNRNMLHRVNRELQANFDVAAFDHRATWRVERSRVEMHLVSRIPQKVSVQAAGVVVDLEAGDGIWTESSYKYTPETIDRLGARSSFTVSDRWTDLDARFALTLFEAVTPDAGRRRSSAELARLSSAGQ